MSNQFKRKASLIVSGAEQAIDLSELRFKFSVDSLDDEAPNTCVVRIYNPKLDTVSKIKSGGASDGEFTQVILGAGYEGTGGDMTIFVGTIVQIRTGKERNVDSFIELTAIDGDLTYNFGTIARTLIPEDTGLLNLLDVAGAKAASGVLDSARASAAAAKNAGPLSRGKVLFGLARMAIRDLCRTHGFRWSIQNGKLQLTPLDGFIDDAKEPVKISSETGMVGVPQATCNGVEVTTLLNPLYRIGQRVEIANKDISQTSFTNIDIGGKDIESRFMVPGWSDIALPASTNDDGIYRLLTLRHVGDTRGQEWYSLLTCLDLGDTGAVRGGS